MCKTVFEFAWRATQQIAIYPAGCTDMSKIDGWGSGFFLRYRDKDFFVTADHCVHMDDFINGERICDAAQIYIFNNQSLKGEFLTMLTPVGGFYYFEKIDMQLPEIPDMLDFTFCIIDSTFSNVFLTHELSVDGEQLCAAAKEKFIIREAAISEFNKDQYYLVEGTCLNEIRNGMINMRCNAIFCDLKFEHYDSDGYAVLSCQISFNQNELCGLSGAPVFDDDYHLVGMLVQVREVDRTFRVVPIKKILSFMDYVLDIESKAIIK